VGPDHWRFYQFKVHQTDYQVVVDVASEQSHGEQVGAVVVRGRRVGWPDPAMTMARIARSGRGSLARRLVGSSGG
jgi:hypothetical protein